MNLWRTTHIREKYQHTVTAYPHDSALYLGRCRGGRDLSVGILTIGERHEGVADRVPVEASRGDGPDRGGRAPRTRCQFRRAGHSHVAGQEQVLQGDCAWRARREATLTRPKFRLGCWSPSTSRRRASRW
jgi:hypothetical protein